MGKVIIIEEPLIVNISGSGIATELTLNAILLDLQLKANLSETQPVSVQNFPPYPLSQDVIITNIPEVEIKNDTGNPIPVTGTVTVDTSGLASETTLQQVVNYLDTVETKLQSIITNTSSLSLEFTQQLLLGALNDIKSYTDGIESALSSLNLKDFATQTTLALIKSKTDNLDVAISTRLNTLGQKTMANSASVVIASDQGPLNINTSGLATEVTLGTRLSEADFDDKIGLKTETAPATDTASSGLNGRLQRIAQRITDWLNKTPSSIGQKNNANSFAVTVSTEQQALMQSASDSLSVIDDWDESDRAKVNLISGQAGVDGGAGPVTSKTIRTFVASVDPTTILSGSSITSSTLITVPANKKWKGSIMVSGSINSILGASAINANVRVIWTPGTGGTPTYTPCESMIASPVIGALSLIGFASSTNAVVMDVEVYAGTTSGTFSLAQTGMTQFFGTVSGRISD